jgi:uncharacterized Rmd1/YagE family protein
MDKPELLWDNPHPKGLYARLAATRSLKTAETLVETMHYQISHRFEFYVVVPILLELFLSAYGHFH